MSEMIRFAHERRRRVSLSRLSKCQLEASFWTGLLVLGWEMPPIRSLFPADLPSLAEWIAVALAMFAILSVIQVKRRLNRRLAAEAMPRPLVAPNPLSLIELLRDHGVRELGSMYLYMPMPKRDRHDAAWVWIDTLETEGLIKGKPWHIKADHVKGTVRESHGHLFAEGTTHFDVYRLDWQTLNGIMGDELP